MCRFEGKNPKNSIVRLFLIGRGSINIRQRIFWTQVGLDKMNDTLPCGNFSPSFPSRGFVILHITLLFFRQLLLYHLPHLHNQLEEAGVAPVVYATPWFITLFAYKNPLHVTWFQWEVFVEERWEIHWRPIELYGGVWYLNPNPSSSNEKTFFKPYCLMGQKSGR